MSFSAQNLLIAAFIIAAVWLPTGNAYGEMNETEPHPLAALGQQLFFDTSLSQNRTQSCSSCHDPAKAFTESRESGVGAAVSLGDDGKTLGNRNTPTLTYAAMAPGFHVDNEGLYAGGFFHDGRAATLSEQAGMPILDPTEMAMADKASVIARMMENPGYVRAFRELFGAAIFDDTDQAYSAMQESISAFEGTALFTPYDSKYDRFLRGEYKLTVEEELGRRLFVSGLTNCIQCHQLDTVSQDPAEPFSSYQYRNIGIPANPALHNLRKTPDGGLLQNPTVDDISMNGKFKVPTLRNVAVTAPYMHNGVFTDLRTTVVFYNQYLVVSEASMTNPETGETWDDPEVPETIDLDLLRMGQPLDNRQVDAMVSFLETLTDSRYEHLLNQASGIRE